jgi:hypothetical protein
MQPTQWYWDLRRAVAVTADERGPGDQVLGPYPSRAAAENWKVTSEARHDAWDDADEKWHSWPDDNDDAHDVGRADRPDR